jgi:uncharacterized membrane protein YesL
MLWFILFLTMTFMYALPVAAQRGKTFGKAMKLAATLALTTPGRSFVVLVTGACIFFLGMMSGAGAGFFAVSAPAMLFNAAAKARFDEIAEPHGMDETPGGPGGDGEAPDA